MRFSPSAPFTDITISPAPDATRRRALLSRSVMVGMSFLEEDVWSVGGFTFR
jgi:hypothetical protein